ncbi:hypothetical protein Krac_2483 [Ktedonobacter racemifer DSM 44963]|uniref:Uncharacterized protein n=1 Tax=Ktedonobacter racemifer DSM 44963 TaxID=485913 RepID=D6U5F8_KTERA|nr:hypothetical protein Krac_2483 [Ktedonobacter racemifer DSM 44963]
MSNRNPRAFMPGRFQHLVLVMNMKHKLDVMTRTRQICHKTDVVATEVRSNLDVQRTCPLFHHCNHIKTHNIALG